MTKIEVRKSPPPQPKKTAVVRFRVDPVTRGRFRALAQENGVTVSALLTDAVARFLAANEQRPDAQW